MGFRTGAYATVWSVEAGKGNFQKVRISISRKNKEDVYEQDFSGFCTFIGHANAKATKLKEKDRIKIGDVDVCSHYDKESKKEYVNYKVFDFEFAEDKKNTDKPNVTNGDNPTDGDVGEDNCPF